MKGQRKPYHNHFRFKKIRNIWYVIYKDDPGHPKSTGIRIDDNESEAINWAYANMYYKQDSSITFKEFARDFFDPEKCLWTRRMLKKQRSFGAEYLPAHRGRLNNYILPQFGSIPLHMITTKLIDEWLIDLDSVRTELPLAPASLNKVLAAIRKILGEAQYQGYLKENPAARVEPFGTGVAQKRHSFTMEEIQTLFPDDIDKAIPIWGTLQWYVYFLIQWTCGLRPGEAGGFMLIDWIKEYHGAVITRSIENRTLQIKHLKTHKKGMTVKPVIFSTKLESVLTMLEYQEPKNSLLFTVNSHPIKAETANKHFKASADRAKIDLNGRTQYCLRHTFYTEALKRLPEKQVEQLAGHKSLRKEYDHRKGLDFLKAAQPLRDVINELGKK